MGQRHAVPAKHFWHGSVCDLWQTSHKEGRCGAGRTTDIYGHAVVPMDQQAWSDHGAAGAFGLEGAKYYAQDFRLTKESYLILTLAQISISGGIIFGW